MEKITSQELKQRLQAGENLQLIDVRSPNEYRAEHIPGAVNIPMERCEARLEDLRVSAPIVLICQSGTRAGVTHDLLLPHRTDLMVLDGGTSAWKGAGLSVVSDSATRWSLERQTRLGAGLLVLAGAIGSLFWPSAIGLAIFVGAGLTFAGLTDICGMGLVLAKMPWNRAKALPACTQPAAAQK